MGEYERRKSATSKPAATGATPTPLPKKPARSTFIETTGHKEASWIRPNMHGYGTHLVARVFFRTKDTTLDGADRRLLDELAGAYARGRHNWSPVSGRVDGFADPRPSHDPGNADLSAARASVVGDELGRAFVATQIKSGYDGVTTTGRGVDPAASVNVEPGAVEGNTLAPFRRADIYLRGTAAPDTATPHVEVPDRPRAPQYSGHIPHFDRYGPGVLRGDLNSIDAVIRMVNGNDAFGGNGDVTRLLRLANLRPVKPPWWDGRTAAPRIGRGGPSIRTRKQKVIDRAYQLLTDYDRFAHCFDERQEDIHLWIDDRKTARTAERVARLGELQFMVDEMSREALAIQDLVER